MMILAAAAQVAETAAQVAEAAATPAPQSLLSIIGQSLYTLVLSVVTIYFVVKIWKGGPKDDSGREG